MPMPKKERAVDKYNRERNAPIFSAKSLVYVVIAIGVCIGIWDLVFRYGLVIGLLPGLALVAIVAAIGKSKTNLTERDEARIAAEALERLPSRQRPRDEAAPVPPPEPPPQEPPPPPA